MLYALLLGLAVITYLTGAAVAAAWVYNSLPECKQAAAEIAERNRIPLLVMKVLLPALVVVLWPITLYVLIKEGQF